MKSKHEFRPFRAEDYPELEAMVLALYREDPSAQRMSAGKIRRTTRELCARPDKGRITLALAGDLVVGYAIVIPFWSNEYGGDMGCIDELYVKPSWRGLGIGTDFLDRLARSGDFVALLLETTPANRRAREFYSRLGFAPPRNRRLLKPLRSCRVRRP